MMSRILYLTNFRKNIPQSINTKKIRTIDNKEHLIFESSVPYSVSSVS